MTTSIFKYKNMNFLFLWFDLLHQIYQFTIFDDVNFLHGKKLMLVTLTRSIMKIESFNIVIDVKFRGKKRVPKFNLRP